MKNSRFLLYFLLLILFSQFKVYSNQLSDSVFNFLKKNDCSPAAQSLVVSGTNDFGYNILVKIPGNSEENLVLTFFQEDFEANKDIIFEVIDFVKKQNFSFNTIFLFTYGDTQKIKKEGMIYGSQKFTESINTSDDYTVLIFDFNQSENKIISNSNGIISPSWLIKNEYNIFLENDVKAELPFFYVSQLYNFKFFYDENLSSFLDNEIPAVKIAFSDDESTKILISYVICNSITKFSQQVNKNWDQHFLIFRHFNSYLRLSETTIVKIILISIFLWIAYILLLFFINTRQKLHAWRRIKNIWYVVPLSFLITVAAFVIGRSIYYVLPAFSTVPQKVYSLLAIQIFTSFFIISIIYFVILLFNTKFEARSIDYLITISCFFNQCIFIFVDISVFPIFMFICALSVLALITKNNTVHIIIFILMILPFIPCAHYIIKDSNLPDLNYFIFNNHSVVIFLSLILYPIYLVYLRILTHEFRNKFKKLSTAIISVAISNVMIFSVIFTISNIRIHELNEKEKQTENIVYKNSYEDLIKVEYSDKEVFDDLIRTINIDLSEAAVQCDLRVSASDHSPVMYSDNEYETVNQFIVYFKIPVNPPESMSFSYGTSNAPETISITAVFPSDKENVYKIVNKTVSIGEN